ncbi:MAG: RMD1 family protein [Patescibacteria group bacterium]|nr:MAG: RMD1 family protein [Patescibacteria group bacterium]
MTQSHSINAYYLAKSLPMPIVGKSEGFSLLSKRRNSLMFGKIDGQIIVVFAFGVVVLYDFKKEEAEPLLKKLSAYGEEPAQSFETEDYKVVIDPEAKISAEFEHIVLPKFDINLLYVAAEVLAQSVAIEHVEKKVVDIVNRFERVTAGLEKDGKIRTRSSEVLKTIGAGRSITQYVLSQLSLLDKPDSTWEDRDVETTFTSMRKMFELEDRFRAIEFRLDFIQGTSELVLDLLQNKRSVSLEWGIIWLFIIDIILVLYEIFVK